MISENTSSMSSLVRAILGGENINIKVKMCDRKESPVTQELTQIVVLESFLVQMFLVWPLHMRRNAGELTL